MNVELLLLINCAIVVNCQSTISDRNDATYESELFEDMKSEMESMRQLLMDHSETQVKQLKSEIEELRQSVTQQRYWTKNG